jgi:hypothetical protein
MKTSDLAVVLVKILGLSTFVYGILGIAQGAIAITLNAFTWNHENLWETLISQISWPIHGCVETAIGVLLIKKGESIVSEFLKIHSPKE